MSLFQRGGHARCTRMYSAVLLAAVMLSGVTGTLTTTKSRSLPLGSTETATETHHHHYGIGNESDGDEGVDDGSDDDDGVVPPACVFHQSSITLGKDVLQIQAAERIAALDKHEKKLLSACSSLLGPYCESVPNVHEDDEFDPNDVTARYGESRQRRRRRNKDNKQKSAMAQPLRMSLSLKTLLGKHVDPVSSEHSFYNALQVAHQHLDDETGERLRHIWLVAFVSSYPDNDAHEEVMKSLLRSIGKLAEMKMKGVGMIVVDCESIPEVCVTNRAMTLPDVRISIAPGFRDDGDEPMSFRVFPRRGMNFASKKHHHVSGVSYTHFDSLADIDVESLEDEVYSPWTEHYFSEEYLKERIVSFQKMYRKMGWGMVERLHKEAMEELLKHTSVPRGANDRFSLENLRVGVRIVSGSTPYCVKLNWINFQGKEEYYGSISTLVPEKNEHGSNYHAKHGDNIRGYVDETGDLNLVDREYSMSTFLDHCWTVRDNGTDELLKIFCIQNDMDLSSLVVPIVDAWGAEVQ